MLAKLKETNPLLVTRLAQRLFFVVNKIDCIHSSTGIPPPPPPFVASLTLLFSARHRKPRFCCLL